MGLVPRKKGAKNDCAEKMVRKEKLVRKVSNSCYMMSNFSVSPL